MHITWLGQSCFKIDIKHGNDEVTVITYPFDSRITGLKLPRTLTADIVLQSGGKLAHPVETKEGQPPRIVEGPGEYEIKGIFIYAIPIARLDGSAAHLFWMEAEHIILVHPGALDHVPSETELQKIEGLDVLFAPVGGDGVLDGKKAAELAFELEPRIVIPMQYKIPGLLLKIDGIEPFLKAVGAKSETIPKFKLTRKDLPADEMKVVVLEKV